MDSVLIDAWILVCQFCAKNKHRPPPLAWTCRHVVEVLQHYPTGVTKAMLITELEVKWRQAVRRGEHSGKLGQVLSLLQLELSEVITGFLVPVDDFRCRLVSSDDASGAVSVAEIDLIMHRQSHDFVAFCKHHGFALLDKRLFSLTHGRLLKGKPLMLLPTPYISFSLDASSNSRDRPLIDSLLLPVHTHTYAALLTAKTDTQVSSANECVSLVFARVTRVGTIGPYPSSPNTRVMVVKLQISLEVPELVGDRMVPSGAAPTAEAKNTKDLKESARTVYLILLDDQVAMAHLLKMGDLLLVYRPFIGLNSAEVLFGNRTGSYGPQGMEHDIVQRAVEDLEGALEDPWTAPVHFFYGGITVCCIINSHTARQLDISAGSAGGAAGSGTRSSNNNSPYSASSAMDKSWSTLPYANLASQASGTYHQNAPPPPQQQHPRTPMPMPMPMPMPTFTSLCNPACRGAFSLLGRVLGAYYVVSDANQETRPGEKRVRDANESSTSTLIAGPPPLPGLPSQGVGVPASFHREKTSGAALWIQPIMPYGQATPPSTTTSTAATTTAAATATTGALLHVYCSLPTLRALLSNAHKDLKVGHLVWLDGLWHDSARIAGSLSQQLGSGVVSAPPPPPVVCADARTQAMWPRRFPWTRHAHILPLIMRNLSDIDEDGGVRVLDTPAAAAAVQRAQLTPSHASGLRSHGAAAEAAALDSAATDDTSACLCNVSRLTALVNSPRILPPISVSQLSQRLSIVDVGTASAPPPPPPSVTGVASKSPLGSSESSWLRSSANSGCAVVVANVVDAITRTGVGLTLRLSDSLPGPSPSPASGAGAGALSLPAPQPQSDSIFAVVGAWTVNLTSAIIPVPAQTSHGTANTTAPPTSAAAATTGGVGDAVTSACASWSGHRFTFLLSRFDDTGDDIFAINNMHGLVHVSGSGSGSGSGESSFVRAAGMPLVFRVDSVRGADSAAQAAQSLAVATDL